MSAVPRSGARAAAPVVAVEAALGGGAHAPLGAVRPCTAPAEAVGAGALARSARDSGGVNVPTSLPPQPSATGTSQLEPTSQENCRARICSRAVSARLSAPEVDALQHARERGDAPVEGDAPLLPASVLGGRAGEPAGTHEDRADVPAGGGRAGEPAGTHEGRADVSAGDARGWPRAGARRVRDQLQRLSLGMRPRRGAAGARSARQRAQVRADARELRWRSALLAEARPSAAPLPPREARLARERGRSITKALLAAVLGMRALAARVAEGAGCARDASEFAEVARRAAHLAPRPLARTTARYPRLCPWRRRRRHQWPAPPAPGAHTRARSSPRCRDGGRRAREQPTREERAGASCARARRGDCARCCAPKVGARRAKAVLRSQRTTCPAGSGAAAGAPSKTGCRPVYRT